MSPDPDAVLALSAGDVLDDTFRIVRRLAQGGMGDVYLAEHQRLARPVAIKMLQPAYAAQKTFSERFKREARILAQLRHPNIVQVLDFNVTSNGVPYLAMELLEGPDLAAALDAGHRFAPAEIVAIVRQVASALDAAHACDIIHRDLKLENVVLCPASGQMPVVKLIDFGLSSRGQEERLVGEQGVLGTPEYMAPEQALGLRGQVDRRTDQYALAVVTYMLLTRRAPFRGETDAALLQEIVQGEPAALGRCGDWDSEEVERVIRKGMARAREDRYVSVLAFADALERAMVAGGALPHPTPYATPAERVRVASRANPATMRERITVVMRKPSVRRRPPPALLAAAAFCIALGFGSGRLESPVHASLDTAAARIPPWGS